MYILTIPQLINKLGENSKRVVRKLKVIISLEHEKMGVDIPCNFYAAYGSAQIRIILIQEFYKILSEDLNSYRNYRIKELEDLKELSLKQCYLALQGVQSLASKGIYTGIYDPNKEVVCNNNMRGYT
jgi:hypothetical protein